MFTQVLERDALAADTNKGAKAKLAHCVAAPMAGENVNRAEYHQLIQDF
jgi:hypothetical protein